MFFGARDDVFADAAGRRLARDGRRREDRVDRSAGVAVRREGRGDDSARADRGATAATRSRRRSDSPMTIEGVDVIALVDYDNDCVKTSLDVARALEGRLWGVRLDTAETWSTSRCPADGRVQADRRERDARLECPQRARRRGVWRREDRRVGRLRRRAHPGFEEDGVPVDAYGVGAALFDGRFDFTADIVQVNGKPQAKAGRRLRGESATGAREVDGRRSEAGRRRHRRR